MYWDLNPGWPQVFKERFENVVAGVHCGGLQRHCAAAVGVKSTVVLLCLSFVLKSETKKQIFFKNKLPAAKILTWDTWTDEIAFLLSPHLFLMCAVGRLRVSLQLSFQTTQTI